MSVGTQVSSMKEVEQYVNENIIKTNEENSLTNMEKQYKIATLLIGIGKHKESLDYFGRAMDDLRKLKDNFVWGRMYSNAGASYATTLDYLGEVDMADQVYQEVIEANPKSCYIGDYAVFLHKRKRDLKKAEILYKRSIELYPDQSLILLKYAGFLRHARKDPVQAEKYYERACSSNPKNSDALGNYASYLHGTSEKLDLCEQLYEKAVQCDPTHANNFCNFGLFLSEELKKYTRAEEMYKHALEVAPTHSNTLYNYAVMLDTHCNRKEEAEVFYRRALDVDPKHSYALYNIAVLLEEIALERNGDEGKLEIASFYKRAVEADSRDVAAVADYGRYLLVRLDDCKNAEPLLVRAVQMDDESEVALYNLGLLNHKYKQPAVLSEALDMYRRLVGYWFVQCNIARNPNHLSGLLQLARLLVEINTSDNQENSTATAAFSEGIIKTKSSVSNPEVDPIKVKNAWMEEVIELYEVIIPRHKEPGAVVCEYTKIVNKYGSARQKMRAIATTEAFVRSQGSGTDGNGYGEAVTSDITRMVDIMKKSAKNKGTE